MRSQKHIVTINNTYEKGTTTQDDDKGEVVSVVGIKEVGLVVSRRL